MLRRSTVRVALPEILPELAAIVVAPLVTAVATPVDASIVATSGAELLQVNGTPGSGAPLASRASALNCCVAPMAVSVKVAGVTGLVMTKLDGTARGGILVALAAKYKLPVHFIGVGEGVDDLSPFAAKDFARAIAGIES